MTEIRPDNTAKYASDVKRERGGEGRGREEGYSYWYWEEWLEDLDASQRDQRGFANGETLA